MVSAQFFRNVPIVRYLQLLTNYNYSQICGILLSRLRGGWSRFMFYGGMSACTEKEIQGLAEKSCYPS